MARFPSHWRSRAGTVLTILSWCWPLLFSGAAAAEESPQQYDPTTLVFPSFLHTYGIRKATRLHLALFTQNKVQFDDPQGLAVVRLQAWEDTSTTKDDDEVTVYGVNSGQHCIIYNTSMKSLGIYGLKEPIEQRLNRPRGIAATARGDVYVADTGNHRLVHLVNLGHQLLFKNSVGQKGAANGQFDGPRGVAVDSQGRVYVTDHGQHRIQVFDANLKWLDGWGTPGRGPGQLSGPDGIAVTDKNERWSYYRENFMVVVDGNHDRLQQFDLQGRWLKQITAAEFHHPDCYLAYITLDYYDNIYVTDTKNHCVHKFDHRLNYLTSYGRYGDGDKEFIEPRGITNYRRFGQMFVAEKWGAQYFWIGTDVFDLAAATVPGKNLFQFSYFLTEPAFVTTDILDLAGRLITRLWQKQFKVSGQQCDYWSGRIGSLADSVFIKENRKPSPQYQPGQLIPPGTYLVRMQIEPTYSSYHYFKKVMTARLKK